ncbi:hypothetical protein [Vibrio anguillarum]|uniref:Uncharacterized protein n=1 Tax=Vibrio anguillarum TaxID=55601 RepID=A0ABR9Z7V8_VIBAN|nr:hypothetical protein [Vibrio anguillarum]MBF4374523.1 hypothetical protein [Vibrio anguillarum]
MKCSYYQKKKVGEHTQIRVCNLMVNRQTLTMALIDESGALVGLPTRHEPLTFATHDEACSLIHNGTVQGAQYHAFDSLLVEPHLDVYQLKKADSFDESDLLGRALALTQEAEALCAKLRMPLVIDSECEEIKLS